MSMTFEEAYGKLRTVGYQYIDSLWNLCKTPFLRLSTLVNH